MAKSIDIDFNPSGTRELLYLTAAALVLGGSLYLDYVDFQPTMSWTQRAGAALVIIGAISESKHVEKVISPDKGITGAPLTKRQKFVTHSGFLTALIGTFLAGYGDLFVKYSIAHNADGALPLGLSLVLDLQERRIEFLKIAFAVAIAVGGWIVAHHYTSKRDTKNSRRATRIEALSSCYQALVRSGLDGVMVVKDDAGKVVSMAGPVEDAIALIHLYGSQKQSDLASAYASEVAKTKKGDSTSLVNCLRSDIRCMLGEEELQGVPTYLKITVEK